MENFHILVFPYPEQGHINPLLYLSTQLALQGSTITFLHTHPLSLHHVAAAAAPPPLAAPLSQLNIRYFTLPESPLVDANRGTVSQKVESLRKQQAALDALIENLKTETPPVACIIADSFLYWTQDVARKLGIACVFFWASSLTTMYSSIFQVIRKSNSQAANGGAIDRADDLSGCIPGLPFDYKDISSLLTSPNSEWVEFLRARYDAMSNSACVLVNSFPEIDGPVLRGTQLRIPVRSVGPLLPYLRLEDGESTEALVAGSLLKEDEECMHWLDMQATNSVLYISFGSAAALPPSEFEELALGIETSRQQFLWVVREKSELHTLLPEGFLERTKDRGLIISWAPQLRVLSHRSVGGFLTHCGWNSILDSIVMGVPMLCLPIFRDQKMNSLLIVKQWQVGLQVQKTENGMIAEGEVERAVRALMKMDTEMRFRSAQLRDAARNAIKDGGSSRRNLQAFIQDVLSVFP